MAEFDDDRLLSPAGATIGGCKSGCTDGRCELTARKLHLVLLVSAAPLPQVLWGTSLRPESFGLQQFGFDRSNHLLGDLILKIEFPLCTLSGRTSLSRLAQVPGLVHLRQTFVRCCHGRKRPQPL